MNANHPSKKQARSTLVVIAALGVVLTLSSLLALINHHDSRRQPTPHRAPSNVLKTEDDRKLDFDASEIAAASLPEDDTVGVYRQLYYNVDLEIRHHASYLPIKYYPVGVGNVIATLVSSRAKDVQDVQTALRSLRFLKGDTDYMHPSPVLVFNEGDLSTEDIEKIVQSTDRPIAFPTVDFASFPAGFNAEAEDHPFVVAGRNPWGYYQMIRFWTTMVWKHPSIQRYAAVMRIDSDSCFKEVNNYLPNFMYDGLYYHSQYAGVEPEKGEAFIEGMYDFVHEYMRTVGRPSEPRNFLLYHFIVNVWENQHTLPLFRTNFELSKISFMQRGDVARFHEAITEKEPFYVLRHRWGDAVLRFLLVAIFESQEKVMTARPTGYFHKNGCSRDEVEQALRSLDRIEKNH